MLWNSLAIPYRQAKKPITFLKKRNILPWKTDKRAVEIEITTACTLACYNCDRSVRQARSDENMSVEQIEKFINESISLQWKWDRIDLIGGEPLIHPKIFEILEIVKQYKDRIPDCEIQISTTGFGKKVREVLPEIPQWVSVRNSNKTSSIQDYFSSYNIAPVDLEEYKNIDTSRGCWITETCGMGLSRYGFYPCGAGASIDRVFGIDTGMKSLAEVNETSLREQLVRLCPLCGHFKDNYDAPPVPGEAMSVSWKEAYARYKEKRPELALY